MATKDIIVIGGLREPRHKAGEPLRLALHELATNAVKHGALGEGEGRIAVNRRVNGSDGARRRLFV